MKKILLTLGTITAVVTPVAAVVACGTSDKDKDGNPIYNFTLQDGRDASVTFHKKGYLISANLPSSISRYSYSSDKLEKVYSKEDITDWNKEDKVNFVMKNYHEEVTPDFERKIIEAVNEDRISFDADLSEDFFTNDSYYNGVIHSEYVGTGAKVLVDLGNEQFFGKLGKNIAEHTKRFVLENDPELKTLNGFRYIDASIPKEQLLANVQMILSANNKINEESQQSSVNHYYDDDEFHTGKLGKYLLIHNSESEIIDLDDYVSRSRSSSHGSGYSNGLTSFEEDVNSMIKNTDGFDSTFELFI